MIQTSPVGVELFSYVNNFFCSNKFVLMLVTWVKTLYKLKARLNGAGGPPVVNGAGGPPVGEVTRLGGWGNPLRWGNPPVPGYNVSFEFDHVYLIGGVTRHMLPHPSRVPHHPLTKGLFTWRWGTPGGWGNALWWGNPPVQIDKLNGNA